MSHPHKKVFWVSSSSLGDEPFCLYWHCGLFFLHHFQDKPHLMLGWIVCKIHILHIQVLHLNIHKNTQPLQVLDSQRQMQTHTHTHTHTKQNSQPTQLSLKMISAVAAACISDSLFPKSFGLLPLPLFLPITSPLPPLYLPPPLYNLSTFTLTFGLPHPASQPSPPSPLSK